MAHVDISRNIVERGEGQSLIALRPWPTFKSALRRHYVYLSFADALSHQELRSKLRFSGRGPVSSAVVQYSREANTGQNQTAPAYGFHNCVKYVTI